MSLTRFSCFFSKPHILLLPNVTYFHPFLVTSCNICEKLYMHHAYTMQIWCDHSSIADSTCRISYHLWLVMHFVTARDNFKGLSKWLLWKKVPNSGHNTFLWKDSITGVNHISFECFHVHMVTTIKSPREMPLICVVQLYEEFTSTPYFIVSSTTLVLINLSSTKM